MTTVLIIYFMDIEADVYLVRSSNIVISDNDSSSAKGYA